MPQSMPETTDGARLLPQPPSDSDHLNRNDPTFDAWRTPREDLQAGREPGLIHLNRYPFALASHGIQLERPHLNPGSSDRYPILIRESSRL